MTYRNDGGIEDIVRARLTEDWEKLTEASISRISHLGTDGHVGIFTSWKGGRSGNGFEAGARGYENTQSEFQALRRRLNADGFPYVRMIGHAATEKSADAPEYQPHSVFVSGGGEKTPLTKERIRSYADDYRQGFFIYSGSEMNHEVHLFDTKSGQSLEDFGNYDLANLRKYHASLFTRKDRSNEGSEVRRSNEVRSENAVSLGRNLVPFAWEYLPVRTLSSVRAWNLTEIKIAEELGLDLPTTVARIEHKLNIRFDQLFDDFDCDENEEEP